MGDVQNDSKVDVVVIVVAVYVVVVVVVVVDVFPNYILPSRVLL